AHDIEAALFGTSLGINLRTGEQVEGGHRNHLQAINTIRGLGSLEKALEVGVLREGITYEALKRNIPMVLAGSIRDHELPSSGGQLRGWLEPWLFPRRRYFA